MSHTAVTLDSPARSVAAWNAVHPVATPIRFWPGWREGLLATGCNVSRTSSEVGVLSGHTTIVMVDGYASSVALTHVQPLPISTSESD